MTSSRTDRRSFLYVATGTFAAMGLGLAAWPLAASMATTAEARRRNFITLDPAGLAEGQYYIYNAGGAPVALRHLTRIELEAATGIDVTELPDPQSRNENAPEQSAHANYRTVTGYRRHVALVAACTYNSCVTIGMQGMYGGWMCPCCGAEYDALGRVRSGLARRNLAIPRYKLTRNGALRFDASKLGHFRFEY